MEWTPEIVRARFVEACDTERRLPPALRRQKAGLWPEYSHSFEDMNGWGTERLAEEREMRFRRMPPSSAAISRHDEVMRWTVDILLNARHRHLVWAWARCRMNGKSFAEHCRKRGMARVTAYRHLTTAVSQMSEELRNRHVILQMPEERWMALEVPDIVAPSSKVASYPTVPQLR